MQASIEIAEIIDTATLAAIQKNPQELERILDYLTPEERRELDTLLHSVIWLPNPGVQMEAFFSPADELFYGGKPGGGKSQLLLGLALTAHKKSIIFRRELKQALDLVEEARGIIGARGRYNGQYHIWRGLPGGRMLEFGGVKDLGDAEKKYKGRPHDLIGIDELPDFLYVQYKFLTGWNRTTEPGQRCRVVCTGNPPNTPEGAWVIDYFAPWLKVNHPRPAIPTELRYFAVLDGEETELEDSAPFEHKGDIITPRSRTFIPASIDDNPFFAGSNYKSVIQSLPEPLRSRLLHGDFTIGYDDDLWQVFPTKWVKAAQERWKQTERPYLLDAIGIDAAYGGSAFCVFFPRFANYFGEFKKVPGKQIQRGMDAARLMLDMLEEYPEGSPVDVNVDVIGYGATTFEACEEAARPKNYGGYEGSMGNRNVRSLGQKPQRVIKVHAVNVGNKSTATDKTGRLKMRNLKAEMAWRFREELDPETGSSVCLPPSPEVLADLTSYRWQLTLGGVILEPKEKQIERIGRSPDVGEALLLASYQGARPPQEKAGGALARALAYRGV